MNVEQWWNNKSEVLKVSFCLPQIPSGLQWDWTLA